MPGWFNRAFSRRTAPAAPPRDPRLRPESEMREALINCLLEENDWLYRLVSYRRKILFQLDFGRTVKEYEYEKFELTSAQHDDGTWHHSLSFRVNITFAQASVRQDNGGFDWAMKGELWVRGIEDTIELWQFDDVFFICDE